MVKKYRLAVYRFLWKFLMKNIILIAQTIHIK